MSVHTPLLRQGDEVVVQVRGGQVVLVSTKRTASDSALSYMDKK